jgi:hypothetical protein
LVIKTLGPDWIRIWHPTTASTEWLTEGQAFSWSYDWLPAYATFLPPSVHVSLTRDIQKDWERETGCWREGGVYWGEELNHTTEKAWSSINHSILSP